MKLTMEFLIAVNTCEEGKQEAIDHNYLGMDYYEVIKDLVRRGEDEKAGWLLRYKGTEVYVRHGGKIMNMGAYQVFNPITGQHTRCETEDEAKLALIAIAKEVLAQYCPRVVQELSNENGDTTWIPTNMNETLEVK